MDHTLTHHPATGRSGGIGRVADELRRLMPRDRRLLTLLAEHQVLTTEQIAVMFFDSERRARRRLLTLYQRGVLDRFRHGVRPGSQAWRWNLGPVGAAVVAAANNKQPPRPQQVRAAVDRLATSPRLHHLLETNQFFTQLAGHARHHPDTRLERWWSERRATAAAGGLVRPDGAGMWAEAGQRMAFWLEVDRGHEPQPRLIAKLHDGYARLAGTHLAWPVLFLLPNPAREDSLHHHLARTPTPMTVATATTGQQPAGAVWRLAGHPADARVRLRDIPTGPPTIEEDRWGR